MVGRLVRRLPTTDWSVAKEKKKWRQKLASINTQSHYPRLTYPVVSSCDFTTETIGENRRQRSEDTATLFPPTGQRAGADEINYALVFKLFDAMWSHLHFLVSSFGVTVVK
jgi:hypothetical protein